MKLNGGYEEVISLFHIKEMTGIDDDEALEGKD